MKAFYAILTICLTLFSFVTFSQSSELSYSVMDNNETISENYSGSQNLNIVTLESDYRSLDILALTTPDASALSFNLIQDGRSGVFTINSNFPIFETVDFAIYNSNGVEINRQSISESVTQVNMAAMSSGTYILHIYLSEDSYQVFRIKLK